MPNCFVSNKAKLCQTYLKKCLNFEQEYNDNERKEIFSYHVPEKPFQQKNITKETFDSKIDDDDSVIIFKITNTNPPYNHNQTNNSC